MAEEKDDVLHLLPAIKLYQSEIDAAINSLQDTYGDEYRIKVVADEYFLQKLKDEIISRAGGLQETLEDFISANYLVKSGFDDGPPEEDDDDEDDEEEDYEDDE